MIIQMKITPNQIVKNAERITTGKTPRSKAAFHHIKEAAESKDLEDFYSEILETVQTRIVKNPVSYIHYIRIRSKAEKANIEGLQKLADVMYEDKITFLEKTLKEFNLNGKRMFYVQGRAEDGEIVKYLTDEKGNYIRHDDKSKRVSYIFENGQYFVDKIKTGGHNETSILFDGGICNINTKTGEADGWKDLMKSFLSLPNKIQYELRKINTNPEPAYTDRAQFINRDTFTRANR